ncbi:MAG TPA: DUF998 domain-containing protein [Gaiellaceae bacterium]|nr:DUF998 domain-containing protein [Gaiellaceae bacterium]
MTGGVRGVKEAASIWAWAAIAGVAAYVALDVVLVFLRPEFSVLHNAESDYGSKGHYGWVMNANFLLRCALSLVVVRALALAVPGRLRTGLWWLGVWAVTSGLLAFFPDDPVGTKTVDRAAKVHLALAAVAFVAVIVGTRIVTRRLRRERGWKPVAGVLNVLAWGALVPVLLLGRAHLREHSLGGLWEKVFLGTELCWFLVVAAWIALGNAN